MSFQARNNAVKKFIVEFPGSMNLSQFESSYQIYKSFVSDLNQYEKQRFFDKALGY